MHIFGNGFDDSSGGVSPISSTLLVAFLLSFISPSPPEGVDTANLKFSSGGNEGCTVPVLTGGSCLTLPAVGDKPMSNGSIQSAKPRSYSEDNQVLSL